MDKSTSVYDLGEVKIEEPPRSVVVLPPRRESRASRPPVPRDKAPGPSPGLLGSLSLFLPGAGQIVAGETVLGLFFLTGVGFVATMAWDIAVTADRLLPTLDLFGIPRVVVPAVVGVLAATGLALQIAAAARARAAVSRSRTKQAPHPAAAAAASAVLPGWGQLLAGHHLRAAVLLGFAWAMALLWIAVFPSGSAFLAECGIRLPEWLRDGWGPGALVAVTLVVWSMGVYDAAAGAAAERSGVRA